MILIAIELLLIMITAPFSVTARFCFSLDEAKGILLIEVGGIKAVKVKLCEEKGRLRLLINGKKPKKRKRRAIPPVKRGGMGEAMKFARAGGLLKSGRITVYAGGENCFSGALGAGALAAVLSLLPPRTVSAVFWDRESDRMNVDVSVRLGISLWQSARMFLMVFGGRSAAADAA